MTGSAPGASAAAAGEDGALRQSLAHCGRVTRGRARNFYYALKLTPEPKRSALYTIYAFMRACDDLADADGAQEDADGAMAHIERLRAAMRATVQARGALPPGPLWPALRWACATYGLDPRHLHAMLDGQRCDLQCRRFDTFDQLSGYCHRVASVVGLVCIAVWGHDGHADVEPMAARRGIALQLTNILRDLREDAGRDRVYLPADELARFDLDTETFRHDVLRGQADDRFDRLMAFQLDRARRCYERSAALDGHIDVDCRPTSRALTQIYRRLLDRIAADPRSVLHGRVRVSAARKLLIGLRASWRREAAP